VSQVSSKLRRGETQYFHWCPGCNEMHPLPDGWSFNGDLERPTFSPSFSQTSTRYESYTEAGIGVGERTKFVCHYILTNGVLNFCGDSMHVLAGQSVPLPPLPEGFTDDP